MLLNRVLHNVAPQPTATASHLSNLVWSEYSQLMCRLWGLFVLKFAAGCSWAAFSSRRTVLSPHVGSLVEGRLPDVPVERSMPVAHAGMQIQCKGWKEKKIPVQPQLLIN